MPSTESGQVALFDIPRTKPGLPGRRTTFEEAIDPLRQLVQLGANLDTRDCR